MDETIRTAAISTLRQRLIDDMNMRRFSRETPRWHGPPAGHDAGRRRVHPPLPASRSAAWVHRIRHYGLLAGSARKACLTRIRELLAVAPPPDDGVPGEPLDARPPCPCCGGHMIIIETFERWRQPRAPLHCTPSTRRNSP
jgi:hypothetical protein